MSTLKSKEYSGGSYWILLYITQMLIRKRWGKRGVRWPPCPHPLPVPPSHPPCPHRGSLSGWWVSLRILINVLVNCCFPAQLLLHCGSGIKWGASNFPHILHQCPHLPLYPVLRFLKLGRKPKTRRYVSLCGWWVRLVFITSHKLSTKSKI